ncbi:hypothetical protein LJC49_03805 [Ruminococcaceae bacterium OttesenSCG-928-I18]|nr:hypothetical protein [Ruminococcaceae bacterium OttesenSCG-928-I18]
MVGKAVLDSFPLVSQPGRETGTPPAFGGSQYWYERHTARYSGCGPVAAANLFAVMAKGDDEKARRMGISFGADGSIAKAEYLAFMQRVYDAVGTREIPGICRRMDERHEKTRAMLNSEVEAVRKKGLGRYKNPLSHIPASLGNSAGSFCRGVLRYGEQNGMQLLPHRLKTRGASCEEGLAFIEGGLRSKVPVVLLSWLNRHDVLLYARDFGDAPKAVQNYEPHFMTIAALRQGEKGAELMVSDRGIRAGIPYASLCESWASPWATGSALLYFTL